MRLPNFSSSQFLNASALDNSTGLIKTSLEDANTAFFIPGLVYSSYLAYTFNNSLTVSLNAPSPFAVLDANGILSEALGTTNGTINSVYSLDFTSFVPSSGSVTVYITATTSLLSLLPFQVIGPPVGHPDYNPNFVPYLAYSESADSLAITLSTSAPNNQTIFELGRVTLTSGQTAVTSVDMSYQVGCNLYISAIEIQSVQNAIQIGQISNSNTAIIAGVIPSGVSNNLIQFLVNGSNVFTVDNNGAITSAGNLNVGGIYATGGITADEGLNVNNAPAYLNAGLVMPSSQNASIGTMTASGLITANGGIDVAGGTITIPNATANNEPIAFIQSMAGAVLNQVTSSRVLGTTYTNTGARPMCVFVACSSTGTGQNIVTGAVDYKTVFYYATMAGAGVLGIFMFVPPGSTYSAAFTTGSGTLNSWIEFN